MPYWMHCHFHMAWKCVLRQPGCNPHACQTTVQVPVPIILGCCGYNSSTQLLGHDPWTGETHRNVTSAKVASTRHLVFLGIDSHGTVERLPSISKTRGFFFGTWKVALKNGKRSIDLTVLHVFVFCISFWKNCFDLQVENKNWHAKVHVGFTVRSPFDMLNIPFFSWVWMHHPNGGFLPWDFDLFPVCQSMGPWGATPFPWLCYCTPGWHGIIEDHWV